MKEEKRILFFYKNEDVEKSERQFFDEKKSSLRFNIDIEFLPQDIIKNLGCFKLTDRSFEKLKSESIPEDIIDFLKGLKDKVYQDEKLFVDELKGKIKGKDTETYKSLILEHAKIVINKVYDLIIIQFNDFRTYEIIGIDAAHKYRRANNDYSTPFCFITNKKTYFCPDYLNPENIGERIKKLELLGNPQFGEFDKAILYGETIYSNKDSGKRVLMNFIEENLNNNFPEDVCDLLLHLSQSYIDPSIKNLKQKYYEIFVYFYDFKLKTNGNQNKDIMKMTLNDIDNIVEDSEDKSVVEIKKVIRDVIANILKDKSIDIHDILINYILAVADSLNRFLNGSEKNPHRVKKELFRSPLPFPFYDLIDAKIATKKILNKGNKQGAIKLLLIDNKIDKVIRKNEKNSSFAKGELWSVLFQPEYGCIFELSMLGKNDENLIITQENKDNEKEIFAKYDKLEKEEKFNFVEFKKALAEYLDSDESQAEINEKNNYALSIYNKMKDAHFILLDFFLNKDSTYLAFDFIHDICEIKKKKCDFSIIWYFITSAIYDSVIKYSESGLLDEYYEYALVNAGDDPTNKKRQIIFMYKLIIFILSRINSNKYYEDFVNNEFTENNHCKEKIKKDKASRDCLKKKQDIIRKYITEYNEITKIFAQEKGKIEKQLKLDITELYDSIIRQYLYLPEADWYRIQMQIDLLNNKLNDLNEKQEKINNKTTKFSCSCIIKELERRAKLY